MDFDPTVGAGPGPPGANGGNALMFSGIIEQTGRFLALKGNRFWINSPPSKDKRGDSIAVNGVCLTLVERKKAKTGVDLGFDLSPETRKQTTLGGLKPWARLNLERALGAQAVLGGH